MSYTKTLMVHLDAIVLNNGVLYCAYRCHRATDNCFVQHRTIIDT